MNIERKLTPDEQKMLAQIRANDTGSVLKLRSSLGWAVSRFMAALLSLERRGLISRHENRVKLTPDAVRAIGETRERHEVTRRVYDESAFAPQLRADAFYMPDYQQFLRAKQRRLYN